MTCFIIITDLIDINGKHSAIVTGQQKKKKKRLIHTHLNNWTIEKYNSFKLGWLH